MNIDNEIYFQWITTAAEIEFHKIIYKNIKVITLKSSDYMNGFINATNLCETNGKSYQQWLEYDNYNILKKENQFTIVTTPHEVRGMYVHKNIILNIGLWLSEDYYDKLRKIVLTYEKLIPSNVLL